MRDDVELRFELLPGADLVRLVEDNVINRTINLTGTIEWFPTNFFLKSARGDWVGGCLGQIWGGWLHIRFLWVTERMRGQALRARLLDATEDHATENGASASTLETFNGEALQSYSNRGYKIFGTLEDYPPGHTKYFLRKWLMAPGSGKSH